MKRHLSEVEGAVWLNHCFSPDMLGLILPSHQLTHRERGQWHCCRTGVVALGLWSSHYACLTPRSWNVQLNRFMVLRSPEVKGCSYSWSGITKLRRGGFWSPTLPQCWKQQNLPEVLVRQARDGSSFNCVFLAASCQGGASVASLWSTAVESSAAIKFCGRILCSLTLWHVTGSRIPHLESPPGKSFSSFAAEQDQAIAEQAPPACISLSWFDSQGREGVAAASGMPSTVPPVSGVEKWILLRNTF